MHAAAPSIDPDEESTREAYLRRVIERQPVCLTRIAPDGKFLAVNDATLSMLGAAQLDEVLATSVLALVTPEHRDQCRAFLARIVAGDRGSTEVDLRGLGGLRYTLQIHAVPLRSVTDSLASALCVFWDVTGHRRLERAVTAAAAPGEQRTWRDALTHAPSATAAEHARTSEALQARVRDLESSLKQAKAREGELVARQETETHQLGRTMARLKQNLHAAEAERNEAIARHQALRLEYGAERLALERVAAAAEAARAEATEQLALALADRAALETELPLLAAAMADGLHQTLAAAARRGRRAMAALKGDSASQAHADGLLVDAFEAAAMARRIRQAGSGAGTHAAVGRVVQSLEGALGTVLGPAIALRVLVGSTDTRVHLTPDQLEQLLMTLVANRRVTMFSGGNASLEVADVHLDETCARERCTRPGAHVLLALHVSGPGVDTGWASAFSAAPADEDGWRAAGPGMAGLHHAVRAAGGHLWATREGSDSIALEIYLPSVSSNTPAASPETSR